MYVWFRNFHIKLHAEPLFKIYYGLKKQRYMIRTAKRENQANSKTALEINRINQSLIPIIHHRVARSQVASHSSNLTLMTYRCSGARSSYDCIIKQPPPRPRNPSHSTSSFPASQPRHQACRVSSISPPRSNLAPCFRPLQSS